MDQNIPNHNPQGIEIQLIKTVFENNSAFISFVQSTANQRTNQPRLLVFNEQALGRKTISREQGKLLANTLHLAVKGKNTYLFYAVNEKMRRLHFSNNGYLIIPDSQSKMRLPYKVYPKLATYSNGLSLTEYDEETARNNGLYPEIAAHNIRKANKKINSFPRITINGITIELRVCADMRAQFTQDPVRARKPLSPADLILVPASGLTICESEIKPLWKEVAKNGIIIINDAEKGQHILKKSNKEGEFVLKQLYAHGPRPLTFRINPRSFNLAQKKAIFTKRLTRITPQIGRTKIFRTLKRK
ncbi:MAG: hypothetical protein WCI04_02865 [archaeon]